MEPQLLASSPSRTEVPHPGVNGRLFDQHYPAAIISPAFVERIVSINELQLLTARIEQLTSANRRKDEFLATLSHELRSPLASIQYSLAILRGREGTDETVQRGMHELIDRQVRQIARLAAGLLDAGRISSGHLQLQLERIDLRAVLARAIETLEPELAGRKQDLASSLPPTAVWVMADPSRLEQVFINLLANASKYTDAGGKISVTASVDNGSAMVLIGDSGIGISAQALPHIFDLYVQADANSARSKSGMGIGLAVVSTIVKLHGGSVTAASEGPGHGSEFAVRLPASA
jgi:signal transduction histidine kinase